MCRISTECKALEDSGLKQQIDGLSADNEQLRRKLAQKSQECDMLKQQVKDMKTECAKYKSDPN